MNVSFFVTGPVRYYVCTPTRTLISNSSTSWSVSVPEGEILDVDVEIPISRSGMPGLLSHTLVAREGASVVLGSPSRTRVAVVGAAPK